MKERKIEVNFPFYEVVSDGGISNLDVGEGRFIPSLIIDTKDDMQVREWINLHRQMEHSGDVETVWSRPNTWFTPKSVSICLKIDRPVSLEFGIEFNLESQYSLVDGIIQSRSFYLQVGKKGDRISEFKHDVILVEVPDTGFDVPWNAFLIDTIKKKYKKLGVGRSDVKTFTREHINKMREIWNGRRNQ